jgi:uroporphyrinogen decarboxylase
MISLENKFHLRGKRNVMNAKERVQRTLEFKPCDRAPVFVSFVPEVVKKIREKKNIQEPDVGAGLGNDMVKAGVGLESSDYFSDEPEYTCPWGIGWQNDPNALGRQMVIKTHPLAGDPSRLETYEIPDPADPIHYHAFQVIQERYSRYKWIIGSCQIAIFEAASYLRGPKQLLTDLHTQRDYVEALFDKVMVFPLVAGKKLIHLGADMVWVGDDLSAQHGMLLSLELWRALLKPRYEVLFDAYKKANPGIKIAFHSPGNCEAILDDLVEMGLDVLHPIEPRAMDPKKIKKRYGKEVALFGGLDVQWVLPKGSPEEVKNEVLRLIRDVGPGGGYILAPVRSLSAEVPLQNIQAFYEAALNPVRL